MRYLGLISLLITVALAVWWLTNSSARTVTDENAKEEFLYENALDSAKDAANKMER